MKTKSLVVVVLVAFVSSVFGQFHLPREVPPTANWVNVKYVPVSQGSAKVHLSQMAKWSYCGSDLQTLTNYNKNPLTSIEIEGEDGTTSDSLVFSTDFPLWRGELVYKTNSFPVSYKKVKKERGNTIGAVMCLYSGITRWSLLSVSNLTVYAEVMTSAGTNMIIEPSGFLLQAIIYAKDPDNQYWRRRSEDGQLMPPVARINYPSLKSLKKSRGKADDLILCVQFRDASINASMLGGLNPEEKLVKAKDTAVRERRQISVCVRFVDSRGNPFETRTSFLVPTPRAE